MEKTLGKLGLELDFEVGGGMGKKKVTFFFFLKILYI